MKMGNYISLLSTSDPLKRIGGQRLTKVFNKYADNN